MALPLVAKGEASISHQAFSAPVAGPTPTTLF